MQTSMQKEKESQQAVEKKCPQKEVNQDQQQKTSNKPLKLQSLLKDVGDCV